MNSLLPIEFKTIAWMFFGIAFFGFIVITQSVGKAIYINRTPSMPKGVYIKITKSNYSVGDKIIFNHPSFKGELIKHVAAIIPSEFCVDEHAVLWIDSFPAAQLNIEKYPGKIPTESQCQQLKPDEIFVLGDHPDSYDSRYFGPIKTSQVIAEVELLWQFK
jgi:type IV secretory pathway protease TraF